MYRRKDADNAYVLGIARRAEPLEHLQSRYSDFQKRMMSNALPISPPVQPPARPALATAPLTSRSGSSSRTTASRSDAPVAFNATHARLTSNRPLQIFVDPTGSESQAAETAANTWTDLGTRKTRIKENVPEVKKLVGTTLKQAGRTKRLASGSGSGASAVPSNSKIIPYRDPSPSDMPPPPVPAPKKTRDAIPRTPSKSLITPFVDAQEGTVSEGVPATPLFTPFRDEVSLVWFFLAHHADPCFLDNYLTP